MPSRTSQRIIRYAPYATAGDVLTAPSASTYLCHRTNSVTTVENKSDDTTRCGDGGERRRRLRTGDEVSIEVSDALRGLETNDGTTITPGTAWSLDALLAHIMGADAATATAASAMTCVAAGSDESTGELVVDDDSKTAPGLLAAFTGSGGEYTMREVVSESSDVLTLDRPYPSIPDNGATIYPGVTYYLDPDADQPYIFFDVEDGAGEWRRQLEACQAMSLRIDFPAAGEVTYTMSFVGNSFTRASAASPSFTAPSLGSGIRVVDSPFFIGDDEYAFRGGALTITLDLAEIPATTGPNGGFGRAVLDRRAELSGSLYLGSSSSPAELPATGAVSVAGLNAEGTSDIALAVGTAVTRSIYLRMPAADFTAREAEADGLDTVDFTAVATRSANHATVPGALRIHVA